MSFKKIIQEIFAEKPWVEAKEIKKVLVIKHGALGDFILATGPFRAIRHQHKDAHITLLTTSPYKDMAEATGCFDNVWLDNRAPVWKFKENFALVERIKEAKFDRVYDLQTSNRSNIYFRMLGRIKPEWSGNIDWCSHPHTNPNRVKMHTVDRQREQLKIAGIAAVSRPNISFLKADISKFSLPERYALLVAGGAKHRPEKRWSQEGFTELSVWLDNHGVTPVFIGTKTEKWHVHDIASGCKNSINLTDKTSLYELAELARHAAFAVGNDTGPMHVFAAAGCPCFVLFSSDSNPDLCRPWGDNVHIMREDNLQNLVFFDVVDFIDSTLTLDKAGKVAKPAGSDKDK